MDETTDTDRYAALRQEIKHVAGRVDALESQVSAMQQSIPTEHALRAMFRDEAQALKRQTELEQDAHRYRQLRTLLIRGVLGILTSGAVVTAIIGWLVSS